MARAHQPILRVRLRSRPDSAIVLRYIGVRHDSAWPCPLAHPPAHPDRARRRRPSWLRHQAGGRTSHRGRSSGSVLAPCTRPSSGSSTPGSSPKSTRPNKTMTGHAGSIASPSTAGASCATKWTGCSACSNTPRPSLGFARRARHDRRRDPAGHPVAAQALPAGVRPGGPGTLSTANGPSRSTAGRSGPCDWPRHGQGRREHRRPSPRASSVRFTGGFGRRAPRSSRSQAARGGRSRPCCTICVRRAGSSSSGPASPGPP